MEFKDGLCVVLKKKRENCLVLPVGSIYPTREALFSAEGIKKLEDTYDNASEYYNEMCIVNQKKYKKCCKFFNMFYLKRPAYMSKQGIDNLIKALTEMPVEENLTKEQTDDLTNNLQPEPPITDAPPEPHIVDDPPPSVPGEDEELKKIINARENAELNVMELQENLDNATDDELKVEIQSALVDAQNVLMEAEGVERDYINKD